MTPASSAPRVLAVDVDGVLVHPRERFWFSSIGPDLGIDPDALQQNFFRPHWAEIIVGRRDLRTTLDEVMSRLNPDIDAQQLIDYWFTHDDRLDLAVLDEIRRWRQRTGGRLVAATDQERHRMAYLRETVGLEEVFDGILFSGDLGVTKSDRGFFTGAAARLQVGDPASILFIDDDPGNIATAESVGWRAHLHTGLDDLCRVLAPEGPARTTS